MNEPENNFSRIDRKKGPNRANTIMNILIAIVVVLIIITASMIFLGGNGKDKATEKKSPETEESIEDKTEDNELDVKADSEDSEEEEAPSDTDEPIEESDAHESGVLINKSPEEEFVKETIIDTDWKPIGTKQKGEHVSLYDGSSDDWYEKIEAISYSTGLSKDNMIIWKIKNGGNSQKSVGIVSSKDKDEKYRVYLDWVDDEGWQPVKMDILKTLDFEY